MKANRRDILVFGFSLWKQNFFDSYLKDSQFQPSPGEEIKIHYLRETEGELPKAMKFSGKIDIIVWGKKESQPLEEFAKENEIDIIRVEDGFLRSVNLGMIHTTPGSLCFDKTGIYYDSTSPSDLEMLLNTYEVSEEEMARGEKLLAGMLENKLSKYNNAKHANFDDFYGEKTRHRVLVIGQVQKDMSLKYGCNRKVTNNDLVRIARRENPNSEVFYKIHPDVLGKDIDNPKEVEDICTILETPMSAHSVLESMDKVYTITSLMGMESLLRGKEVVCIGAPFYSNWGLTDDRQMVIRRKRSRTLMELFVISYIVYPKYMDVHSKTLSTPENTLKNLVSDYERVIIKGGEDRTLNKVGLVGYLKHFYIKNLRKIKMKLG